MHLNPKIAEILDDEDYSVQDAIDFLQDQIDSGILEGLNEGAVCVVRDALAAREERIEELETALNDIVSIEERYNRGDAGTATTARNVLNPPMVA